MRAQRELGGPRQAPRRRAYPSQSSRTHCFCLSTVCLTDSRVSPMRAGSTWVIFIEKLWGSAQSLELTRSVDKVLKVEMGKGLFRWK